MFGGHGLIYIDAVVCVEYAGDVLIHLKKLHAVVDIRSF